jgi:hypothetical protein
MKAFILASLIGVLAAAAAAAAGDPVKELASIHDFAFGGIGAAGTTSKGELAFREILKEPSAEKQFVDLLESGNAQARCYALVALHVLNPTIYADRVRQFEHESSEVSSIAGCMIMVLPMSSIVPNISSGRYDFYLKPK